MSMTFIYVLCLGSNIEPRKKFLSQACKHLISNNIQIILKGDIQNTSPQIETKQADFLNQLLVIQTTLPPLSLLFCVKDIEKNIGRKFRYRYGPREIDIDILWWSEGSYEHPQLQIPHPLNQARDWIYNQMPKLLSDILDKDTIQ